MRDACLIMVDIQNDFMPGGALAVPQGDEIVPLANRLATRFEWVVAAQDWHPAGHTSFASAHPGRKPFETTRLSYGRPTKPGAAASSSALNRCPERIFWRRPRGPTPGAIMSSPSPGFTTLAS